MNPAAHGGTGDGLGSHTTSSGREVILSWKIRSQQSKVLNGPGNHLPERGSSTAKESGAVGRELPEDAAGEDPSLVAGEGNASKKPKRSRKPWEIWSEAAKDTFFDALNEHGKDFGAIQSHFAAKVKKKTLPAVMMKNKEQVRHFYYRTWHKISKHLALLDDVKKGTLELYALINYGELRRKMGNVLDSEKSAGKLRELVQSGMTRVRVRGKTIRIRTPLCRALKKINDIDVDAAEREKKLPEIVRVELRPRTGEAFARVQSLAQNPRLTANMSLQRRLSSLIRMLERKWRPINLKKRLELINAEMDGLPNFDEKPEEPECVVRLFPKRGVSLSVIKLSTMESSSKIQPSCLSLNSHRERWKAAQAQKSGSARGKGSSKAEVGTKNADLGVHTEPHDRGSAGTDDYDADADDDGDTTQSEEVASNSDDELVADACVKGVPTAPSLSVESSGNFALETELCSPGARPPSSSFGQFEEGRHRVRTSSKISEEDEEDLLAAKDDCPEDANVTSFFELIKLGARAESNISEFLARHRADSGAVKDENETSNDGEGKLTEEEVLECERVNEYANFGWVRDSAKRVTIGELYLMFGRPAKIMLDYEFVEIDSCKTAEGDEASARSNCDSKNLPGSHPRRLLKRLVEFASFSLQKSKAIRESQRFGGTLVPIPFSKACNNALPVQSAGALASSSQPSAAGGTTTTATTAVAAAAPKKRARTSVEVVDPPDQPHPVPTAVVSATLVSRDDFLFRVPLAAPAPGGGVSGVQTAPSASSVPNGAGSDRHQLLLPAPGPPQIKKLIKGDMIVRRIVPVATATDPGGGPPSQPVLAKRSTAAARKTPAAVGASKKYVFHQTVPKSSTGSATTNQRMNEALKRLLPTDGGRPLEKAALPGEQVISEAGGNLQTSFPVNYGMRKVVRDSLEGVEAVGRASEVTAPVPGDREYVAPAPLPENEPPPASPSALSLLMDISFPDSEVAMASQIMAGQRSLSPAPSSASASSFSSFTGLIRSLADAFEHQNPEQAGVEQEQHGQFHEQRQHEMGAMNVVRSVDAGDAQPTSDVVEAHVSFAAGPSSGVVGTHRRDLTDDGLSDDTAAVLAELCPARTPPLSPSHVLLESDNQWLASEVMDVSLGSLLRHLDLPTTVTVAGDFPSPSTSNGP